MPLFALANAGVRLVDLDIAQIVVDPVTVGVALGLVLGKPIGVTALSWVAVRLGLSSLPSGVAWRHILGGGILAGIGFTMSLFISNLAYRDTMLLADAKFGIIVTSIVAGAAGYAYLRRATATPVPKASSALPPRPSGS